MAKWYQYLTNDENLGKVVQLSYIDDVEDDDMVIFHFNDGGKCNREFIASYDNMEAFNGRYMMVEIQSPNNVWKFNKKEIDVTQTTQAIGADGNTYEVPQPGVGLNGVYDSQFSHNLTKGTRIEAITPRIIEGKKIESEDGYKLSENPNIINEEVNTRSIDIFKTATRKPAAPPHPIARHENSVELPKVGTGVIEIPADAVVTVNHPSNIADNSITHIEKVTTLDIDGMRASGNNSDIIVKIGGESKVIDTAKLIEIFTLWNNGSISQQTTKTDIAADTNDFREDVLVKNLIDKAKKTTYEIGMELTIELPPKSVYDTIKVAYDEDICVNFINAIAMRMKTASLKQALADGLKTFYESDIKSIKTSDNLVL